MPILALLPISFNYEKPRLGSFSYFDKLHTKSIISVKTNPIYDAITMALSFVCDLLLSEGFRGIIFLLY